MKQTRDEIERILGYRPNRAQMIHLLNQVKEEGIPLAQACARMMLPPVVIPDDDGLFYCDEAKRRITPEEWEALNPAHKYMKLIIII
jgi:hypothetical protein